MGVPSFLDRLISHNLWGKYFYKTIISYYYKYFNCNFRISFFPIFCLYCVFAAICRKLNCVFPIEWKQTARGEKTLLIEGACRIGKSAIVEEFAKHEYKSYILIDFNDASNIVFDAFDKYFGDLDTFFMLLSTEYGKQLYPGKSLIIFDGVQKFPKARQSRQGLYHSPEKSFC